MRFFQIIIVALFLLTLLIFVGCAEDGDGSLMNESAPGGSLSVESTTSSSESWESSLYSSVSSVESSETSVDSVPDYSHLNIPTEFTEEDRELQKVLRGLVDSTDELTCCFGNILTDDTSVTYKFIFSEEIIPNNYYLVPKNFRYREGSTFTVPTTYSEWSEAFHRYFTEEATESWLKNVGVGTLTENSDGTFEVSGVEQPVNFLELDGKMYCWEAEGGRKSPDINVKTAKVKSKTEDTITFSYLGYNYIDDYINFPEYSYNSEGVLKLEGDSWKLDFFYGIGFNHD